MQLDKILEKRVSARKFLDEKLSKNEIENLINAAKKAPIGHGYYDTVHLTVITDKNLLKEMSNEYNELQGKKSDSLYGANTFIMFSSNKTDLCEYEDAGCVLENISLKATEMGLGSCYIRGLVHGLGADAKYVKKLNLPEGFRPISGIIVGKIDYELEGKVHNMEVSYIE